MIDGPKIDPLKDEGGVFSTKETSPEVSPGDEKIESKDSSKKNSSDQLYLRFDEKETKNKFNKLNSLGEMIVFLEELQSRALSKKEQERFGIVISAIQKVDSNIENAMNNYSQDNHDFLSEGDIVDPIMKVSDYNKDLTRKVKDILISNDFVAKYLGLKFLPNSPYASKWLDNLKKIQTSCEQNLAYLKKNDPQKNKGTIERLEQEIAKTADFIQFAEETRDLDKDALTEEVKNQIPKLVAIAKEILKHKGEMIDIKELLGGEDREDLGEEIKDLLSKNFNYLQEDDSSTIEELEEEAEEEINFKQLKKLGKKIDQGAGFNLYLEKKLLPEIALELNEFFSAYPEEKNNYPILAKLYENILKRKAASEEEAKEAAGEISEVENTLIETSTDAPTAKSATEKPNPRKKAFWEGLNTVKDGALSLLFFGGGYMLSRMIESPLDFIFFFSEPRLTEKGFNWKGIDKVLLGDSTPAKKS